MGGSSGQYVVNCIVPAHSSLSMRSESGDLDVAGPVNNLESSSGSGSISANEVVYANINTGSGTISIDECTGDGSLSAGSGTISVDHCSGHVSASTGSGNVHLGTLEGDVKLTTGCGSVSVHKAMSGTIIASAGTGSIRIGVARGAQVIKSRGTITSMYPVSDTLGDPVAGAPGSGNTVRLHQVYTGLGRIKLVRS
jgi:DUF4097 and DUF4098 domain-containing protein YvlB